MAVPVIEDCAPIPPSLLPDDASVLVEGFPAAPAPPPPPPDQSKFPELPPLFP